MTPRGRGPAAALAVLAALTAVTAALELGGSPQAFRLVPACLALGSALAAVAVHRAAARLGERAGRPWRTLALAACLLAVGQTMATLRAAGGDLSGGGVEDLPLVAAVPVAVAAAVRLVPARGRRSIGSRVLLDAAVVVVAVAVLASVLLADLVAGAAGVAEGLIAIGYPAVGALLCGVGMVTLTAVDPARRPAAAWLLAACVAMAVVAVGGALGRTLGGTALTVLTELAWFAMLAAGVLAVAADPGPQDRPAGPADLPSRGVVLAQACAYGTGLVLVTGVLAGLAPSTAELVGAGLLLLLSAVRSALWAADGQRLTRRLQRAEAYFRALVDSGEAVTVVLDGLGRVRWASGAVDEQLGWAERDLLGCRLTALLHAEDRDPVRAVLARLQPGGGGTGLPMTVRLRTGEGSWRDVELTGAARGGPAGDGGTVLHLRDVSDRSSTHRELQRMAFTDYLTGLPNRAAFMAALAEPADGCVLLVDLDGFKAVNDVAGHDAGDRLLCEVAGQLRTTARDGDTVARLGGDEFAVLVRAGRAEATALAERLVTALDREHRAAGPDGTPGDGPVFSVSGSVGLADLPAGTDPGEALRRADVALRAAKAAGKRCVRTSGAAWDRALDRRARLVRDLPAAVAGDALTLVHQPVVDARDGRLLGLAAAVRWDHPELGPVPPEELVRLAEDDGLVVPLQRWVLARAGADLAGLLAAGHDLTVTVEVSGRYLQAGCLAADVTAALDRAGVPARRLVVELAGSALSAERDGDDGALRALAATGCRLAVGGFGRGHTDLGALARLPLHVLTVDRSLVAGVAADRRVAAVVAGVIALGRTLGIHVVAEGVQTGAQLAVLRRLGCPAVQGPLPGAPVPAGGLPGPLARVTGAGDPLRPTPAAV